MPKRKGQLFTPKQEAFISAYSGSIKKAAAKAGLNYQYCKDLATRPDIIAAIRERDKKELKPLIATRQDRQKFWTDTMNDPTADLKDRLKASELLGKSNADFTDKILVGDLEKELQDMPDEVINARLKELSEEILGRQEDLH